MNLTRMTASGVDRTYDSIESAIEDKVAEEKIEHHNSKLTVSLNWVVVADFGFV